MPRRGEICCSPPYADAHGEVKKNAWETSTISEWKEEHVSLLGFYCGTTRASLGTINVQLVAAMCAKAFAGVPPCHSTGTDGNTAHSIIHLSMSDVLSNVNDLPPRMWFWAHRHSRNALAINLAVVNFLCPPK